VCNLHIESCENHGEEGLLAKTDASTSFLTVDCNANDLVFWAEIGDLVLLLEPGHNFRCSCGSFLWGQH
jgi:hypothetical protein